MNKQEFIEQLQIEGKIITKRCAEPYLQKHNILQWLLDNTPVDFATISDKIKYQIYGGGYCLTCGIRTSVHISGKGFGQYCKDHFHDAKKGKSAHNRKNVVVEDLQDMYINQKMSIRQIAQQLGNISNVTLKKRLTEANIDIRTHSDNQKLFSTKRGIKQPLIIIDRKELIESYNNKTPIKALAEIYKCHPETIRRFLIQEGVIRYHRRSYIEYIIKEFLDGLGVEYLIGSRKLLSENLEIDFYIPQFKIGIEVNGLYTHSFYTGKKDKNYHNNKFIIAEQNGIKLLQFWEPDIVNKPDLIKSMLFNKCTLQNTKTHARKCIVKDVNFSEASLFYNDNHIQGTPSKSTHSIGLFVCGELISLIGFIKYKEKTYITRFCSKKFNSVVGGFSRLLSKIPGKEIITFSSNDISDGALYKNAGFKCTSSSYYDMWYTDYKKIYNRQQFMKSKLSGLFENFDQNLSETQNMIKNGYDVIYKSGTKTWKLLRSLS
jgi:very-short-patch-repair endonuclease